MRRITVAVAAAVLTVGVLAATVVAAEEASSRSGTASIEWRREGGGNSGGGNSNGESSGGGRSNSIHQVSRDPTFVRAPAPEAIVSIPNPHIPLGRLPETGSNLLIPLLFVSAGISLLLACAISVKGSRPP